MSRFHVLLLPLFLAVLALGKRSSDEEIERGNKYVDRLIEDMMEERGDEYDPYRMEDSSVKFSKKIAFVNISGEAKLFHGRVNGLKTLHRVEDCSLTEKNDRLYVTADLGLGIVNLEYEGTVKFMNLGPTVQVHGKVDYIEVKLEFSVNGETGKNGTLHKFTIDDLQGMKVWISGLGPLNWAVNPILTGVTKIFKRIVKRLLENKVESHIRERLPNFQFPVDRIIEDTTPAEIITEEPETESPEIVTVEPETEPPEIVTEEPETESPEIVTEEPETEAPETEPPEIVTEEPETEEPETEPPEIVTEEPETEAPETEPPEIVTEEPETEEPETEPPEKVTEEPETEPPEIITEEPETEQPEIVTEEPENPEKPEVPEE